VCCFAFFVAIKLPNSAENRAVMNPCEILNQSCLGLLITEICVKWSILFKSSMPFSVRNNQQSSQSVRNRAERGQAMTENDGNGSQRKISSKAWTKAMTEKDGNGSQRVECHYVSYVKKEVRTN
jgi:hypothetical protein